MVRLLNAGSGKTHVKFADMDEFRIDIDPNTRPNLVLDLRELCTLEEKQFDVVWMNHVLEHFNEEDVNCILQGSRHVLKENAALFLAVPDILEAIQIVLREKGSLSYVLFETKDGTEINTIDMIYGSQKKIQDGNLWYEHKMAFDPKNIKYRLYASGFDDVIFLPSKFEIVVLAIKGEKTEWVEWFLKKGWVEEQKIREVNEVWKQW
jgi:ubiquinone/menaquinone biosynthesis C-methylase UbiE